MSTVFNVAKGRVASYGVSVGTGGARLVIIPLLSAGLEADATISDYTSVSAMLAGTNDEQTTMGRKFITAATVTPDNTNDRNDVDCADITWTAVTAGSGVVGALVFAFDSNGSQPDSGLIPLTKNDWVFTPDGGDVTATVSNFFRATN